RVRRRVDVGREGGQRAGGDVLERCLGGVVVLLALVVRRTGRFRSGVRHELIAVGRRHREPWCVGGGVLGGGVLGGGAAASERQRRCQHGGVHGGTGPVGC